MDEAGHTRVRAEIVLTGNDQRRQLDAGQFWRDIAGRQHGIGGGIAGGVVLFVASLVLHYHVRIGGAELVGEPARHEFQKWLPGMPEAMSAMRSITLLCSSSVRPAAALSTASRSMRRGCRAASVIAIILPSECPATCARAMP